jgi:hypothetical protein
MAPWALVPTCGHDLGSQSLLSNQDRSQDIRVIDGPIVNALNCVPWLRVVGEKGCESGRVQTGAEIRRD